MNECCSSLEPKKHVCPVNGKTYGTVPIVTMMHHINQPWNFSTKEQTYYFCDDPNCDVVYFGLDNSVIKKDLLRTKVGVKEKGSDSMVCYCFGVNREQSSNNPEAKAFVIQQTKNHACACETSNPSGRCCLKDFSN